MYIIGNFTNQIAKNIVEVNSYFTKKQKIVPKISYLCSKENLIILGIVVFILFLILLAPYVLFGSLIILWVSGSFEITH